VQAEKGAAAGSAYPKTDRKAHAEGSACNQCDVGAFEVQP